MGDLLEDLAGVVDGHMASFAHANLREPAISIGVTAVFDPDALRQYAAHYAARDPWVRSATTRGWVEQKNGSVVRRLVGYGRLEGIAAGEALSRLYSASRLFVTFFKPSFELADKERIALMSVSATTHLRRPVLGCWPRRPSPNR